MHAVLLHPLATQHCNGSLQTDLAFIEKRCMSYGHCWVNTALKRQSDYNPETLQLLCHFDSVALKKATGIFLHLSKG